MTEAFGIPFVNRIKRDNAPGQRDVNNSEFVAFAALCASLNVAIHVRSVMWDGNIAAFDIDVDAVHEYDQLGGAIGYAADATMSQYVLFGCGWHKGSLEDEL